MPDLKGMPVSNKPIDYGSGGTFRIARRFVPAASTVAGAIWMVRNPSASLKIVVNYLAVSVLQIGAPSAAIEDRFTLLRINNYATDDATGSASIAPAAGNQKLRSTSGNSIISLRERSGAANPSGGSGTPDGNNLCFKGLWVPIALQTASIQPPTLLFELGSKTHPLVLEQNDGFIIQNDNALGTASGIVVYLDFDWAEVQTF